MYSYFFIDGPDLSSPSLPCMLDGISIKTPYVFSYLVTVVTYTIALVVTWEREEKCLFVELLCCLNKKSNNYWNT